MKNVSSPVTFIVVLAGAFMLCRSAGFVSGLGLTGAVFWPIFLHFWMTHYWTSRATSWMLAIASFLFGVWFIYLYRDVFVWRNHPESHLLFAGLKAVPTLGFAWLLAWCLKGKARKTRIRSSRSASGTAPEPFPKENPHLGS